jgi:hypothetical protein
LTWESFAEFNVNPEIVKTDLHVLVQGPSESLSMAQKCLRTSEPTEKLKTALNDGGDLPGVNFSKPNNFQPSAPASALTLNAAQGQEVKMGPYALTSALTLNAAHGGKKKSGSPQNEVQSMQTTLQN